MDDLRNAVNYAEGKGALSASLPQFSRVELQSPVHEEPVRLKIQEHLNSSHLVEREREALKAFFGKEVPVSQPPALLLETQKVAEAKGFDGLKPFYFPTVDLKQKDNYPGWKVKPEEWYWEQIKEGKVSSDSAKLDGYWALLDESIRPSYNDGRQVFENDMLAGIVQRGRQQRKIAVPNYLRETPDVSRFGISLDEQDRFVFPKLTRVLRLADKKKEAKTRRPTEMEFNFAGNLCYPHLGQTDTAEWFEDKFVAGSRLIGGSSDHGGLAYVHYFWSDYHDGSVAFRPLVAFPPKT